MDINVRQKNRLHIVSLSGRLDAMSSPDLEKVLMELIDNGVLSILLDLREIIYISSAGLRTILMAAQKLFGKGKIVITNPKVEVKEVLEMTGFDTIMPIFDSMEEALKCSS